MTKAQKDRQHLRHNDRMTSHTDKVNALTCRCREMPAKAHTDAMKTDRRKEAQTTNAHKDRQH